MPSEDPVTNDRCVSGDGLADEAGTEDPSLRDNTLTVQRDTNASYRHSSPPKTLDRSSRLPVTFSPIDPSMALKMSFADWRQASSENMLATAETLLDELESVADLLTQIDEKLIACDNSNSNGEHIRDNIVERFHEGVESAKGVVSALRREKWRLSKREMSVELKMGELEEYKSHLKNDMSSMNQTVDVLSLRIVQLENQLVEAQEVQETLEAEVLDHKKKAEQAETKCSGLQNENENLRQDLKVFSNHTSDTLVTENTMLRNELVILHDENKRLKELVRNAEVHPSQQPDSGDDHLARLTRDFLRQLSNLENQDPLQEQTTNVEPPPKIQQTDSNKQTKIQAN